MLSFLQIPEHLFLAKTMSLAAQQSSSAVSTGPGPTSTGPMSLAVSKAISIFSSKDAKTNSNPAADNSSNTIVADSPALASGRPVKGSPAPAVTGKENLILLSTMIDSRRNPREILLTRLLHGILVIKHGRQGNPKKRVVRCDAAVTVLTWSAPAPDAEKRKSLIHSGSSESDGPADKVVLLKEVQCVRMGTEIDPSCSAVPIDSNVGSPDSAAAVKGSGGGRAGASGSGKQSTYTNDDSVSVADSESVYNDNQSVTGSAAPGQRAGKKRSSLFFSAGSPGDKTFTGTATLRRHVKQEDLSLCFSLILPNRSFDIQCLDTADFDFLFYNLKNLCAR